MTGARMADGLDCGLFQSSGSWPPVQRTFARLPVCQTSLQLETVGERQLTRKMLQKRGWVGEMPLQVSQCAIPFIKYSQGFGIAQQDFSKPHIDSCAMMPVLSGSAITRLQPRLPCQRSHTDPSGCSGQIYFRAKSTEHLIVGCDRQA